MPGQFITVRAEDGGEFRAYMAKPEKGSGPGLVLLQEIFGVNQYMRDVADLYAEEGYVVLCPDLFWRIEPGIELGTSDADRQKAFALLAKFDVAQGVEDIKSTVERLRGLPELKGRIGALGFCLGGRLAYLAAAKAGADVAVSYYGVGIEQDLALAPRLRCPLVLHFGELDKYSPPEAIEAIRGAFAGRPADGLPPAEIYVYPGADHAFARPAGMHFDKPASLMAHSRSIAAFRRAMGPHYDLSALWEAHTFHEFAKRDVPATMATMVAEPYVNHVPTMTGGVGHKNLSRFYEHHFVNGNPADTKLIPISRTIGADRLVDEMLFCFTHDREIDWMLPGIKPTGRYVEVPLVAIVGFRGDKIWHEHIYWDQASVLVQIGLLDPRGLPIAGIETAKKLVDETLPSNTLMARWAESEPKAAE
jgi:carboxymethylenebutenolidase